MKLFASAIFLLHFCLFGRAMEPSSVPEDIWSRIFLNLSWQDRHNVSLTSKWLRRFLNKYENNFFALKKIASFTKSKNVSIVFCCSKKTFCIFQAENLDNLDCRSRLKMIDGYNLEQRNSIVDLSLTNNHFTAHEAGICYSQGSKILFLSVDKDQILSESLPAQIIGTICRLNCVGDDNIIIQSVIGNINVFNVASKVNGWWVRPSFGISKTIDIKHLSGAKKDIILFLSDYNIIFENRPGLALNHTDPFKFPIIASANNSRFIVICHMDEKSSIQSFSKIIIRNVWRGSYEINNMPLQIPLNIEITKLFLQENNLLIVGNVDVNNWLLMLYSVAEEKTVFSRKFNGQPLEIHHVGNHIFLAFKTSGNEAETENFEIMATCLDHLPQ